MGVGGEGGLITPSNGGTRDREPSGTGGAGHS